MSKAKKPPEEQGPNVPAYIVTFSDMVTLLLTFFVMLLTLAEVQDPELFDAGRDSFVDSITYMGLGMLDSRANVETLEKVKIKYAIPEPEPVPDSRLIDFKEEHLRKIFAQIKKNMETQSSQLKTKEIRFAVTSVKFPKGGTELDKTGRDILTDYARNTSRNCPEGSVKLYVVALANDVRGRQKQWLLSAQRACIVEGFLRKALPAGYDCPIYSSGAGPKTNLIEDDPSIANSQVLIAVLRKQQR